MLVLALLSWLSCIYEQAAFADPTLFNIRPANPSPALALTLTLRNPNH